MVGAYMKSYAIVESGKVVNVIEAETDFALSIGAIPLSGFAGIGWTVNGLGEFSAPIVIPTTPQESLIPPPPLTRLQFMDRFTDAELAGIYTTAKQSVPVEIWLEKFKLSTEIDLTDPRTIAGIEALEAGGLLDVGRAAEILA
jgi:hypothetical protein